MGVTLVGMGGVVGYAWYDQNFREQVETNVPYSKEAIHMVLEQLGLEEETSSKEMYVHVAINYLLLYFT